MKKTISSLLATLMLLLAVSIPVSAEETETPQRSTMWSSMSSISQSVTKSGSGVNCYYTATAYGDTTKIVVSSTLYEKINGNYQSIYSWSFTYNTNLCAYSGYRATSGGDCKILNTYKTYIGSTLQETISVVSYT